MIDGYGPYGSWGAQVVSQNKSPSLLRAAGCVWKCRVPHLPNGFADHYPVFKMAISLGIYPTFSDKPSWLRPATTRRSHAALLRPSQLARWLRSSLHAQRRGAPDVSLGLRLGVLKMGYPWLLQMSWIIIFRIQKLWYMVKMVKPIFWQTIIGWVLPLTKWAIGVPNHLIHNPKSEWPAWGG